MCVDVRKLRISMTGHNEGVGTLSCVGNKDAVTTDSFIPIRLSTCQLCIYTPSLLIPSYPTSTLLSKTSARLWLRVPDSNEHDPMPSMGPKGYAMEKGDS